MRTKTPASGCPFPLSQPRKAFLVTPSRLAYLVCVVFAVQDLFTLSGLRLDIMDALGTEVDLISELPESASFRNNLKRDEVLLYEA